MSLEEDDATRGFDVNSNLLNLDNLEEIVKQDDVMEDEFLVTN